MLKAAAGDAFFTPAGRICNWRGAGTVEIQQTSDITYRIYDGEEWADGNPELHTDLALDAIDFKQPVPIK